MKAQIIMKTFERIFKGEPFHLYVLTLQNGKYYVGISSKVNWRIIEHQRKTNSSKFVKENLPIIDWQIFKIALYNKHAAEYLETAKTIELIRKYGVENVNGGYIIGDLEKRKQIYKNCLKKKKYSII